MNIEKFKYYLKKNKFILIGTAAAILLIGAVSAIDSYAKKAAEKEVRIYDYNETEQKLADDVRNYLSQYMNLPEQKLADIADMAVQNYNIVISSDTDVITDEITDAVRKRIRSTIVALSDTPEKLTDDTLDALASGVTEIIWNTVIAQLSELNISANDQKEDYEYLIASLQEQVDVLKERKTKVSINANIIDNTDVKLTGEDLLASIESMSEEEIKKLSERMGISAEELQSIVQTSISSSGEDISDKMEDEIAELRKELQKEISTTAGKQGETGKTGAKGEKGEQGAAGANGKDGKTTYIAYADDAYGTNFSLTPTETSKYIGTCITAERVQPTDRNLYSNWQEYRTYVITSTTDPDTGITTVHIN